MREKFVACRRWEGKGSKVKLLMKEKRKLYWCYMQERSVSAWEIYIKKQQEVKSKVQELKKKVNESWKSKNQQTSGRIRNCLGRRLIVYEKQENIWMSQ